MKAKYRCIVRNLLGEKREITTFFFANTDRNALGRVVIYLEMSLGMCIKAENIKVTREPSLLPGKPSNIVTARVETPEKPVPAMTAFFILESEYQALKNQDEKDALVDALQGLETVSV